MSAPLAPTSRNNVSAPPASAHKPATARPAATANHIGDDFVAVASDGLDAFLRQLSELGLHAGVARSSGAACFRLADNAAAFRRLLAASLAATGANGVAAFLGLFSAHVDADLAHLRRALRPVLARSAALAGVGEPSLVRLLLGNALLQAPVAALLLEKFCLFIDDEEQFVRADLHANVPKLILRQLRFLECVYDGAALAAKLVEVLGAVPLFAKRELLACLPEIIDDSCHAAVVPALQLELEQSPELAVPILDAVAQLNVDPQHLAHTRRTAVALLGATRLRDTPLVVRFLILSAPAESCTETVVTLREQLGALLAGGAFGAQGDVDADDADDDNDVMGGAAGKRKAKRRPEARASEADAVTLLVDSMRSALASRRDVAKAWVILLDTAAKRAAAAAAAAAAALASGVANSAAPPGSAVIDESPPAAFAPAKTELGVADVWLMLCQRTGAPDGDMDALVRRLVACDLLSGELLRAAVQREFAAAVELLGSAAVGLAGALVRGSVQAQRDAGCALYTALFAACKSDASRTGLIGALVTHVGSSAPLEMEAALQTLVALAESRENAAALLQLAPYINGLLDFLEGLNDAQVRLVFRIFTAIAGTADGELAGAAEGVRNELRILMHKQLAHADITYKRVGVIGAVTTLTRMASAQLELSHAASEEASDLVSLLFERASSLPTCMALLFDELAAAVPKLHALLTTHVLTSLLHVLPPLRSREQCEADEASGGLRGGDVDARFWYGHGERQADERCCDVIGAARLQELQLMRPQLQQTRDAAADAAAALAASLRLAQAASRALRSGGIGDALHSSLHMFAWHGAPASLAPLERMTQARSLFYAGDWLRQTASGAALDALADASWSGADERLAMVRRRIGDMLENERRLELFLRVLPEFCLPTVQGGAPLLRLAGSKRGAAKPKSAKPKKAAAKRQKKKKDDDDDGADDDGDNGGADNDNDDDDDDEDHNDNDDKDDEPRAPAEPAAGGHLDLGDSLPLVEQLRALMRELDVAVFAAAAYRGAISPLVLEALCGDFQAKLAAHAALEKPLTAKRSFVGAAAFLTAHTPQTAITLVLPAVCALPTHLGRFYLQLMQRSRAGVFDSQEVAAADDGSDDDTETAVLLKLPDGAPELLLERELLQAERAFVAICHALTATFRSSAVRRATPLRDTLIYQLARTVTADVGAPSPPRGVVPAFVIVFDHLVRLGRALPRVAQFDTATALLDTLCAMVDLHPAADEQAAQSAAQLSKLAEQWLRASWTLHRDGKLHAEPMRRVVHACVQHAPDKQAMLFALANASARFNLAAAHANHDAESQSPLPVDDTLEKLLLPPPQMLVARKKHGGRDDNDDDDDEPLSRRMRSMAPGFNTLTNTTVPYWIAALNAELVAVFKAVSTEPSPRYVENVRYICDLVRVWRIVMETCNCGATPYVLRSALRDGVSVVGRVAELVKSYLQHRMIECIEPISVLLEDVARGSHLLHAACATTKNNKDATVSALVPRAKRMLESLSLSLRAALTANKLSDSFSVFTQRDLRTTPAKQPKKKAAKEPAPAKESAKEKPAKEKSAKEKPAKEKPAKAIKRSPPATAASEQPKRARPAVSKKEKKK